jgi:ABC-type lipoprotein export system ATPase subunit
VTHEQDIAACAKRLIRFRDGRIERQEFVTQRRIASKVGAR